MKKNIKKQVGLALASTMLGAAMIGGGTWAAFNDVETLANDVATGTLDMDVADIVSDPFLTTFNLSNLKPGDEFTRTFRLQNNGSLAIKEAWLDVVDKNWNNGVNEYTTANPAAENDKLQFLDQFAIEVLISGMEAGVANDFDLITLADGYTLKDLVQGNIAADPSVGLEVDGSGRINLAPSNASAQWTGIPASPLDYEDIKLTISMIDDPARDGTGEYTQNKYQGDNIDLDFVMEATQWNGNIFDNNNTSENAQADNNPGNNNPNPVTP